MAKAQTPSTMRCRSEYHRVMWLPSVCGSPIWRWSGGLPPVCLRPPPASTRFFCVREINCFLISYKSPFLPKSANLGVSTNLACEKFIFHTILLARCFVVRSFIQYTACWLETPPWKSCNFARFPDMFFAAYFRFVGLCIKE